MLKALLGLACASLLAAPPAWWQGLRSSPRLESPFIQESDSAVFGKVRRTGRLQVAPGGKVRVAYDKGLLVVCDGRTLVQYDPAARTAQRASLRSLQREMPLLSILVDPKDLDQAYEIRYPGGERLELIPRRPGGIKVDLEGRKGLLWRIHWVDATGAGQTLELTQPRAMAPVDAKTYRFQAPAGTRWIGEP
ncbi:LolA family protein [Holophaga foetida]|uniref:LolA family protein n=1 Tax=Holophaga foetida TaxID=35839 RepID=UPI000247337B|nr:outer-membrane lipoprotein carrier protein LolA [Holophaga foetida]